MARNLLSRLVVETSELCAPTLEKLLTRTRFLQTAAALMFLFPLAAGAVRGSEREQSGDSSSIDLREDEKEGVTGRGLAVQVDSDHEKGLQRGHHHRRRTEDGGAVADDFDGALKVGSDHSVALADHGGSAGEATAPVPEPSGALIFALGLFAATIVNQTIRHP